MSTNNKLITVFGSTGAQGNAIVESLLKVESFKVRALTRDPTSEKSKKLIEQGVEVVKFDESDSKESIKETLKGSYGVFLVTNISSKESEYGIKIADAAFEVGVQHFVFSGLESSSELSNGSYQIAHFDEKSKIEKHIRSLSTKRDSFISSFVYAAFYYQNFTTFFQLKKNQDGSTYSVSLPSNPAAKPMDLVDITDIGPIVTSILSSPSQYSGKIVPLSGDVLTGQQIAETFSKVTGKTVSYNYIPTQIFKTFAGEEFASMFDFFNEIGVFNSLDKTIAPKIHKLNSLEQYLTKVNYQLVD